MTTIESFASNTRMLSQVYLQHIVDEWAHFASLAYSGYTQAGRGIVVIDLLHSTDAADVYYATEANTANRTTWPASVVAHLHAYDPETEALFVVFLGRTIAQHVLPFQMCSPDPRDTPRALFDRAPVTITVLPQTTVTA